MNNQSKLNSGVCMNSTEVLGTCMSYSQALMKLFRTMVSNMLELHRKELPTPQHNLNLTLPRLWTNKKFVPKNSFD